MYIYIYIHIWWFPEIGVPPNHPFLDGIFPFTKTIQRAGGTSWLWKPPIQKSTIFHSNPSMDQRLGVRASRRDAAVTTPNLCAPSAVSLATATLRCARKRCGSFAVASLYENVPKILISRACPYTNDTQKICRGSSVSPWYQLEIMYLQFWTNPNGKS